MTRIKEHFNGYGLEGEENIVRETLTLLREFAAMARPYSAQTELPADMKAVAADAAQHIAHLSGKMFVTRGGYEDDDGLLMSYVPRNGLPLLRDVVDGRGVMKPHVMLPDGTTGHALEHHADVISGPPQEWQSRDWREAFRRPKGPVIISTTGKSLP